MAYIYEAIRRNKENESGSERMVLTQVYYGDAPYTSEDVVSHLRAKCQLFPGKWRIYRTVNRRNTQKAKLEFVKVIIDQLASPGSTTPKQPESLWKSILAQPHNALERLFLIDIDCKDQAYREQVRDRLVSIGIEFHDNRSTPNGYHLVTSPFNPALLDDFKNFVEVKKDALLFIEDFEVMK